MMGEESIYNLIPRDPQGAAQHSRKGHGDIYNSKFRSNVKDQNSKNKAQYKTMGQAKVPTRSPADFLKKHEKEPQCNKPENTAYGQAQQGYNNGATEPFKYQDDDMKKPSVPKRDERPIMGLKTTKNFITQNAVENIMSVPKKPEKNYVDSKKGDKHLLDPSGLEPRFIHKKEFGKTPVYLMKRQEEIEQAQQEYDSYVADHFRRGALKQLTEEDRQLILAGLKSNWEHLHHEYQGLSVVTDTAPKKNRKERMEAEMKQLERDIETIEKHRVIYIAN